MTAAFLLIISYYLLNGGYTQSCSYGFKNETTGKSWSVDVGCMNGMKFDWEDAPYHFLYTPCRNGDSCYNDEQHITGMVVQSDTDSENPQCFLIAKWDGSGAATYNDAAGSWKINFANGDDCFGSPREFDAVLVCDPSTEGIVTGVEEVRTCEYEMTIRTKYGCPGTGCSDSGISGGSVFIIIFFSGLFLYFLIGYLVMAFVFNKDGGIKDFNNNIPQKEFWCILPSLVIAGCLFSKDFIVGLFNKDGAASADLDQPITKDDD